jgi:hypothetical protein
MKIRKEQAVVIDIHDRNGPPFVRYSSRMEDNIKMYLDEVECKKVDLIWPRFKSRPF